LRDGTEVGELAEKKQAKHAEEFNASYICMLTLKKPENIFRR